MQDRAVPEPAYGSTLERGGLRASLASAGSRRSGLKDTTIAKATEITNAAQSASKPMTVVLDVGDVDLVLCHHGPGPDFPGVVIPPPLRKLLSEWRRDPFLVALRREVVGRRRVLQVHLKQVSMWREQPAGGFPLGRLPECIVSAEQYAQMPDVAAEQVDVAEHLRRVQVRAVPVPDGLAQEDGHPEPLYVAGMTLTESIARLDSLRPDPSATRRARDPFDPALEPVERLLVRGQRSALAAVAAMNGIILEVVELPDPAAEDAEYYESELPRGLHKMSERNPKRRAAIHALGWLEANGEVMPDIAFAGYDRELAPVWVEVGGRWEETVHKWAAGEVLEPVRRWVIAIKPGLRNPIAAAVLTRAQFRQPAA